MHMAGPPQELARLLVRHAPAPDARQLRVRVGGQQEGAGREQRGGGGEEVGEGEVLEDERADEAAGAGRAGGRGRVHERVVHVALDVGGAGVLGQGRQALPAALPGDVEQAGRGVEADDGGRGDGEQLERVAPGTAAKVDEFEIRAGGVRGLDEGEEAGEQGGELDVVEALHVVDLALVVVAAPAAVEVFNGDGPDCCGCGHGCLLK